MRRFFTSRAGALDHLGTRARIDKFLKAPRATSESLRETLINLSTLETAYEASKRAEYTEIPVQMDIEEVRALLGLVLQKAGGSKDAQITNQTLLEYFTANFPPSVKSSLLVLDAFNSLYPNKIVPETIAMIPFRRALYEADFGGALDVMNRTCGTLSNYASYKTSKLRKIVSFWGIGVGAIATGVHSLLMSGLVGAWDSSTSIMISGMFGTYLTAISVYGTLTVSGSKSGLGSVLEWLPGTSMLYRYKHSEQLKMATLATELNRSLPENLGEVSPQLLQDLKQINLKPVETSTESMLKEYWARGGEGFDWVEPDQDPADLLWRQHMEATKQQRITSAYSRKDSEGKLLDWISEVEREKQGYIIPHASLLDVDELRSPEGMKTFEQELSEDVKLLKNNGGVYNDDGTAQKEIDEGAVGEEKSNDSAESSGEDQDATNRKE